MPIQIVGLRDFIDKNGTKKKATRFFQNNWHVGHIEDIFNATKRATLLKSIPATEQYNLYFTVAECSKLREMDTQKAIPFDIDWVVVPPSGFITMEESQKNLVEQAREALATVIRDKYALPIVAANIAGTWSGHGVQLFVMLKESFSDKALFGRLAKSYKKLCVELHEQLTVQGIEFRDVDSCVFSHARLMRLPDTTNKKEGHPDAVAHTVPWAPAYFPLFLELEEERKEYTIHDTVLKAYSAPDTAGVLSGCQFLGWARDHQASVLEPQWYAMLSVVSRLKDGAELCHKYSKEHPRYDEHTTDTKIQQALDSSGPRTCAGIDNVWGECSTCPYYASDEIRSPIQIKSPDYIRTEATGYRTIRVDKDGVPKPGPLDYGDLLKAYSRDHEYKSVVVGNGPKGVHTYLYRDDLWSLAYSAYTDGWVESTVPGNLKSAEVREFSTYLDRTKQVGTEFFSISSKRLRQFSNCVLNIDTMQTQLPSADLGMRVAIPHIYRVDDTCPNWDAFILAISQQDESKAQLLHEFMGYVLFSNDSWLQKSLMLVGDGANGKSVYVDMVREVVGAGNCSNIRIGVLGREDSIAKLEGKLVNVSGEVSVQDMYHTATLKDLITGGTFTGRLQYETPRDVEVHAKFLMACNEIPAVSDQSYGFMRRNLVVRCDAVFKQGMKGFNPHIKDLLRTEIPGIINRSNVSYKNLVARGFFDESLKAVEERSTFMEGANLTSSFLAEYFMKGGHDDYVPSGVLISAAKMLSERNNTDIRAINTKTIAAELRRKYGMHAKDKKIKGRVIKVYMGLATRPDTDLALPEEEF